MVSHGMQLIYAAVLDRELCATVHCSRRREGYYLKVRIPRVLDELDGYNLTVNNDAELLVCLQGGEDPDVLIDKISAAFMMRNAIKAIREASSGYLFQPLVNPIR